MQLYKMKNLNIRSLIKDLGGPTKVSKIVGVHRSTIHNWQKFNQLKVGLIIMALEQEIDLKKYWEDDGS